MINKPDGGSGEIDQAYISAVQNHRAGRLKQAEDIYRQILRIRPRHAGALHLLGMIAHQQGNNESAVELIGHAIRINPSVAEFHGHLALALGELNRPDQAIASFCEAIRLAPRLPETHYNLANTLRDQGRHEEAIGRYRKALEIQPGYADAWRNMGNSLVDLGRLDEATACFEQAAIIDPGRADDAFNLGNALTLKGRSDAAIAAFKKALAIKSDSAQVHNNLGNVYKNLGRFDDAAACYRLALEIQPEHANAHNNLGELLKEHGKLDEAIACYQAALRVSPGLAEIHNNLGDALKDSGQIDRALDCFQRALTLNPSLAFAFSNRLLTSQYSNAFTAAARYAEHREFANRFERPLHALWRPHENLPAPDRRLKIGYVSPDFRQHPAASFVLPILANHNRENIEAFCYYNHHQCDSFTDQFAELADHWRPCHILSDNALAGQIREDGIDILVDLAGHTARNRLLMFARKPAPVQVSYLGYIATTGLSAMDYRLTCQDTDPPGAEAFYSEALYRLKSPLWWCYRPHRGMPDLDSPPCLRNGYVTFGSTNNLAKVSPESIALWSEVLHAVPRSRLLIAAVPQGSTEAALRHRFKARGVDDNRLVVFGRLPYSQFWALHHQIDIALDPFPYNGGTTVCDSLWMGVPSVALVGTDFVSRMSSTLLKGIGLSELAALNEEDYVKIAKNLAGDPLRLEELRSGMRQRLSASPLLDESGFTRSLEAAYRDMWKRWCSRPQSSQIMSARTVCPQSS